MLPEIGDLFSNCRKPWDCIVSAARSRATRPPAGVTCTSRVSNKPLHQLPYHSHFDHFAGVGCSPRVAFHDHPLFIDEDRLSASLRTLFGRYRTKVKAGGESYLRRRLSASMSTLLKLR